MIDKEKFGSFVSQLRKEKGMTQKELAEKLFLSDKAVSKWERGLSVPDIAILTPLAEALDVTVAELLNCERMKREDSRQAEELLQKAISLSEEVVTPPWKRWTHWLIVLVTWLIVGIEWSVLGAMKHDQSAMRFEMGTFLLLPLLFGIYFWFVVQEKLPKYYDENDVRYYYHNGMKMNIPGVKLNNSNWPHIVKAVRAWCVYLPISVPLIYGIGHHIILQTGVAIVFGKNMTIVMAVLLIWALASLFIPLIYVGRKYQ